MLSTLDYGDVKIFYGVPVGGENIIDTVRDCEGVYYDIVALASGEFIAICN